MNPHSYRLKGRDFVHQGKIEIDVNERAVFIRTQGCFFVYTNSDCFLNSLPKYQKTGLLNGEKMKADITKMINAMKVKTPSMKSKIANLSGGNQQKVILGRWLLTDPDILLLDEPTRGIDVGAKFEIYQLINQLAEQGKGIIVVSSEMPELFGISDRILVMSNGHQSAIFDSKEVGQVDVMQAAARFI